jgi:hypothetical protein
MGGSRKYGAAAVMLFVAAAMLALNVQAARVDLFVFENTSGADTTGLDLWVDVLDVGGTQVDFVFHNDSSISSIVTQIYFESTLSGLISGGTIYGQTSGVSFTSTASPTTPAGGEGIDWAGELFAFGRANQGGVNNGINAGLGESLTIRFDYAGLSTHDDLLAALMADGRIAQHVQGLPGGGSIGTVSGWNEIGEGVGQIVIPLPAAAWMGLAMMSALGLGSLRRRRRAA